MKELEVKQNDYIELTTQLIAHLLGSLKLNAQLILNSLFSKGAVCLQNEPLHCHFDS